MFALWRFGARKLQDFPQFAAYKMQKKITKTSLYLLAISPTCM